VKIVSKDGLSVSILYLFVAAKIFLGKLTQTGPLRGFIARLKASPITFGIIFEFLTVHVFLVMGVNKDC
jgi:hypothetical protein